VIQPPTEVVAFVRQYSIVVLLKYMYADLHVAESENLGIVRHSPNAPGVGGSPLLNHNITH
jgi:hypothetical protein